MAELTPEELSKLKGTEWIDGRWYYDPYEIMRAMQAKAQLAKCKDQQSVALTAAYFKGRRDKKTILEFQGGPDCAHCEIPLEVDSQKQKIEDAVREERERIIKELDVYINQVTQDNNGCHKGDVLIDPVVLAALSYHWQSLKEGD